MEGLYKQPVSFRMTSKEPGIQVPDVIRNAVSYLMVSESMKELLEANSKGATVEYLPFVLLNHKKRVAAERCFIVNVIDTVDCGDRANSEGPETPVHPGELFMPSRLAILEKKIPEDVNLFRSALFPAGIWVRDDLRTIIEAAKMRVRFIASGEEI
jgi:hypothetical protein